MNPCETCRYWSELCAQSINLGPLEALCLSHYSPNKGKMTEESDTCECWADKIDNMSVDDPHHGAVGWPQYPDEQPPNRRTNMKPIIPTTPELDAAYIKYCDQYKQCIDCLLYKFSRRGSCLTAFKEAQVEVQQEKP